MFFILTKIVGLLIQFILHSLYLGSAAFILHLFRQRQTATFLFCASILLPVLYSITPIGAAFLRPLENHAPQISSTQLGPVDGIIILGGHTKSGLLPQERGQGQVGGSAERFITALALADRYPDAEVWFSGLSGALQHKGWSEAQSIRALLGELGKDIRRFQFEEASRNTAQNSSLMFEEAQPLPGQRWVLVTSASHMRRAAASFAKAGWTELILYPVDYQTRPSIEEFRFNPSRGFGLIRTALHEYIGMAGYWLTGKV
jgi:uncharacterized SAM-binding protein YcdF (DUF218 family)